MGYGVLLITWVLFWVIQLWSKRIHRQFEAETVRAHWTPEDYRLLQAVSIINLTLSALAFLALIILTIISCYDLFANPNGSLAREEGACLLLMCLCMATEALLTSWLTTKLANH